MKNVLLFFDGLALLVLEYKLQEPEDLHPDLAGPLRDRGLLEYLTADEIVDAGATKQLADAMSAVISSARLRSRQGASTTSSEMPFSLL